MSADLVGEPDTILDLQVAALAATVTRAVPGVARLQPGLWGLVQQLSRELWKRVTGEPYPDLAGVEAEIRGRTTAIDITLVTDGHRPAAEVAADVQHAVTTTVTSHLGIVVTSVAVHVCEINLPVRGSERAE
ncbi:MAG: Asp23/Gls24 family envelope stress response protein [Pseudonocardia sp.]